MGFTILGDDPGTKNYGRSVCRIWKKGGVQKYSFKYVGLCKVLVDDLKGCGHSNIQRHQAGLRKFKKQFGPIDQYVAERFMARGRNGVTGECVSFMIASNICVLKSPTRLLSAATWKNAFHRQVLKFSSRVPIKLDEVYKWHKIPNHCIDASLMALYQAGFVLNLMPFAFIESKKDLKKLISSIYKAYTANN